MCCPSPSRRASQAAIPTLKLDIVHSQSPFFLGVLARRVARALDIPACRHQPHSLHGVRPLSPPADGGHDAPAAGAPGCADFTIPVTAFWPPRRLTRRVLAKITACTTPVTVVPTGIPAPPYVLARPADVKQELGLPPDARILLFVGRLAPEKNLDLLLRAFARIARPDQRHLSGPGRQRQKPERCWKSRRGRWAFTAGRASPAFWAGPSWTRLYQAADVFLFPSKTETQGLAVGEALAAGLPCVVVNAGGAPESVRDGVDGFLVADDPVPHGGPRPGTAGRPALHRRMADAAKRGAAGRAPDTHRRARRRRL